MSLRRPNAKKRAAGFPARLAAFALLVLGAAGSLFPFYFMAVGGLSPAEEVGRLVPSRLDLSSWRYVLSQIAVATSLLNSAIYAGGVILVTLVVGSLTGYALARLSFFGRDALFNLILLTLMLPFQLSMIPLYIMVVNLGWAQSGPGNYLALIAPTAVNAVGIVIFRQFFRQLPQEIFDAARVDGCSELGILRRIVLPLSAPAILIVTLITFIGPWNDFLWPLLVTKDRQFMPFGLAVALFGTGGVSMNNVSVWGAIAAAATMLALPVIALFLLFQRYFVQGIATTGLKE